MQKKKRKLSQNNSTNDMKNNKRELIAERLKTEIDKNYKTQQEFIDACQIESGWNNRKDGALFISKSMLSQILHLKSALPPDKAEIFARVLNINIGYLLGYEDYPTNEERKKAQIISEWKKQGQSLNNRVKSVQSFLDAIIAYGYTYRFVLKKNHSADSFDYAEPYGDNCLHLELADGQYPTSLRDFLEQFLSTPDCIISPDNDIFYKVCGIHIVNDNNFRMLCSIDEFMRLVYDMELSITSRMDYWRTYKNYDHKETFSMDIAYWDN